MFGAQIQGSSCLVHRYGDRRVWCTDTGSTGGLPMDPIPEYTAVGGGEWRGDSKSWRLVEISERTYRVDMKAIEPYKKVLAHGGLWSGPRSRRFVTSE